MSDTIAAVATGAAVSAIGIIRLSGEDAVKIVDTLFTPASGKPMADSRDRSLVYGTLHDGNGEVLDMCLCTVSHAPHSYTGEDTAELQCHGSPLVLRTALEAIFSLGARQAGPGEFTKRAFLNGRMELSSAEAVADLIDAETRESARNAAAQLSGAIGAKIDGIYRKLADISSHYHAVLDYPDEDIEDFTFAAYENTMRSSLKELRALLSSFEHGKILKSGIAAAIVGRPNAGKSSLLNALLGYERAIVTPIAGTTRDTIEEKLHLGSLTLRLIDTAGLHDTTDTVERLGVERSRRALESADLVIAVVDASGDITAEDADIILNAELAPKGVLVLSKKDISEKRLPIHTALPTVSVSAVTGEGLDELEKVIASLFPFPSVPAGEILTNARQADAVTRASEYLEAALSAMSAGMTPDIVLTETEGAMQALGELTGRTVREDVTDQIFRRFCVGK